MAGTYTESQAKATKKYYEKNKESIKAYSADYEKQYDSYKIRFAPGQRDQVKAMAEEAGKTMNQFIIDKIFEI